MSDVPEEGDMDGRTWIDALPAELADQRELLTRLLDAIEGDLRVRWLEVGCSVAQHRGDALSDLDLGLGVVEDAFPDTLGDLVALLGSLGEVIDILRQSWQGTGPQSPQRIFVQYGNGTQIDLVAIPAHLPKGVPPENVVLYDPDGLRSDPWPDSVLQPDATTVREWAFLGWIALADLTKYLQRGSLWEALDRLNQTRDQIWRLWAVAQAIRYPQYGLTSVLDHPAAGIPPGIEESVASLDLSDLLRAAVVAADLLDWTGVMAAAVTGGEVPGEMARFVRLQLEELVDEECS